MPFDIFLKFISKKTQGQVFFEMLISEELACSDRHTSSVKNRQRFGTSALGRRYFYSKLIYCLLCFPRFLHVTNAFGKQIMR